MASGSRKVRIARADLPAVTQLDTDVFGYALRHRVISEDRNRFSGWAPPTTLTLYNLENLPPQVNGSLSMVGESLMIVWGDSGLNTSYDIFYRFPNVPGLQEFSYHGTTPIHTYSILDERGGLGGTIDIEIQVESINHVRSEALKIYQGSIT